MSKTPRTDEQELAYAAEDGSTYVHTTFARQLERENAQLRKDKERLDWLLDEESDVNVEYIYTDKLGKHVITWFDDREGIDKAMKEHYER